MGAIRLLLAGAVLLGHLRPGVVTPCLGPQQAVQAFFVISGFYMALVLEEKYARFKGGSRVFFLSRFARLYPAYLLVGLWSLAVQAIVYFRFDAAVGAFAALVLNVNEVGAGTRLALLLPNLFILGQDGLMFLTVNPETRALQPFLRDTGPLEPAIGYMLLPHTWSLATELAFYALAPWLVRRSNRFLGVVLALSLAGRGLAAAGGYGEGPLGYHFFPFELAFFLGGVFAYRLYRRSGRWKCGRRLPGVVLAAGLVSILGFRAAPWFTGKLALLMVLVALATPVLFVAYGRSPLDRWLGDLSYPVYLVHPLIGYSLSVFGERGIVANAGVTLLAAAAIVVWVERPLDRWRQRRLRRIAALRPAQTSGNPCAGAPVLAGTPGS